MFETVLFPVDQSRETMETSKNVIELASKYESKVILMGVMQSEGSQMNNPEAVNELLEITRKQFDNAHIHCEVVKREGKPAFSICDFADEFNIDLIVVGTRGISLDRETESTATRVIQLAPCPVLVVP